MPKLHGLICTKHSLIVSFSSLFYKLKILITLLHALYRQVNLIKLPHLHSHRISPRLVWSLFFRLFGVFLLHNWKSKWQWQLWAYYYNSISSPLCHEVERLFAIYLLCIPLGTGTGKTLSYVLPILEKIYAESAVKSVRGRPPCTLVMTPTRELALQVRIICRHQFKQQL